MRVLVLGGTGAMGSYLVNNLSDRGDEVVVTSRKERQSSNRIQYICGNAHDSIFIQKVLSKPFDAIVDFMSYKTEEFKQRYLLYLNSTNQYIFLSSARVYADSKGKPLKEDSPRLLDICTDKDYINTDEYALTKARQENLLRDSSLKNWTIIRPYITYSSDRLQLGVLEKEYWLSRALKGHSIVFSEDMLNKTTTLTYGFDVSRSIAALIGNPESLSSVFHITGISSATWGEILQIYTSALKLYKGLDVKTQLTKKSIRLKFMDAKWQVIYDRYYNRVFDNSKIAKYIDMDSFLSIEQGLTKCIEEFLLSPKFLESNWMEDALYDRVTGEKMRKSDFRSTKIYFKYLLYRYFYGIEYIEILKQKIKQIMNIKAYV